MPRPTRVDLLRLLADYLAQQASDEVTRSFDEIAAIIGVPLPLQLRTQVGFWTARRYDYANRRVVFWRDAL